MKSLNEILKNSEQTSENLSCKEFLLESKPLSVAIWKDENLFYLFDSKPRDKNGHAVNIEQWLTPSEIRSGREKREAKIKPEPIETKSSTEEAEEDSSAPQPGSVQKTIRINEGANTEFEGEKETNIVDFEQFQGGEPATVDLPTENEEGEGSEQ